MSKKTVSFQIPVKEAPARQPARNSALAVTEADRWVQSDASPAGDSRGPGHPGPGALTITISSEPDWFEAIRIACFLPYLIASYWTLGLARKQFETLASLGK